MDATDTVENLGHGTVVFGGDVVPEDDVPESEYTIPQADSSIIAGTANLAEGREVHAERNRLAWLEKHAGENGHVDATRHVDITVEKGPSVDLYDRAVAIYGITRALNRRVKAQTLRDNLDKPESDPIKRKLMRHYGSAGEVMKARERSLGVISGTRKDIIDQTAILNARGQYPNVSEEDLDTRDRRLFEKFDKELGAGSTKSARDKLAVRAFKPTDTTFAAYDREHKPVKKGYGSQSGDSEDFDTTGW